VTPLIVTPRPNAAAPRRLYAFPHAGVGPSAFRGWADAAAPDFELRTVQLPGREGRLRETPLTDVAQMATAVADALRRELDRPFVFYGHSLGSLVAFEVTRRLRDMGLPLPDHLFVAAHRAPHLNNRHTEMHRLDDTSFITELRRRYDAVPQMVLDSPELMALLLPAVRADITAYETYRHLSGSPLPCPISGFAGDADRFVRPADMAAWRDHTSARFRMRILPAGHLFAQTRRDGVIAAIREDVRSSLAPLATRVTSAPLGLQ
jgi:medium-chain acyl-[acyl-carrier-protein] hydrolase